MTTFEKINDVLVHLFQEIWELEEKAIITEEFKDITNNDMHIIEAVGLGEGNNMTTIAKKMKITVGSLTTSMNSLVKKHYVERNRSEEDRRIVNITLTEKRRVVLVKLTEKGIKAYKHHEEFHEKMSQAAISEMSEDEVKVLLKSLNNLSKFFHSYDNE